MMKQRFFISILRKKLLYRGDNMNNEKDKVGNITSVEADGKLAVKSDTTPYIAPFYFMEFFDEKAVKKIY